MAGGRFLLSDFIDYQKKASMEGRKAIIRIAGRIPQEA